MILLEEQIHQNFQLSVCRAFISFESVSDLVYLLISMPTEIVIIYFGTVSQKRFYRMFMKFYIECDT